MASATSVLDFRLSLTESSFVEIVIWEVPDPVQASAHAFKYRLALVSDGVCRLRYDNEAGKGDHKHIGAAEIPYKFRGIDKLQADFWKEVELWLKQQDAS